MGLRRRPCTQKVGSQGIHVHMAGAAIYILSFSAFVLISVTTDMSPTSRACSGAFMCCAGMTLEPVAAHPMG